MEKKTKSKEQARSYWKYYRPTRYSGISKAPYKPSKELTDTRNDY